MALPTLNGWMRWYLAHLEVIGSHRVVDYARRNFDSLAIEEWT